MTNNEVVVVPVRVSAVDRFGSWSVKHIAAGATKIIIAHEYHI